MNQQIIILLSTYNGANFLDEFLDSLLAQTHDNWLLIVRDDGSTDSTCNILKKFSTQHRDKIIIINNHHEHIGAMRSFAALCMHYGEYTMFADQDDIWLPEKIAITFSEIKKLEGKHGKRTPLLVHTDFTVTNKNLEIIRPKTQRAKHHSLKKLLLQNSVTGCTAMCNKALMDIAVPIPEDAQMHDYWVALIASATGYIAYVPTSTVLYRQHDKNAIGTQHSIRHKIIKSRTLLNRAHNQAVSLRNRLKSPPAILEQFIIITGYTSLYNRVRLIQQGFGRDLLLENIAIILCAK